MSTLLDEPRKAADPAAWHGCLERCAERLYSEMESLDPSGQGPWTSLNELDKEFYRQVIKGLLDNPESLCCLLSIDLRDQQPPNKSDRSLET